MLLDRPGICLCKTSILACGGGGCGRGGDVGVGVGGGGDEAAAGLIVNELMN